MRPWWYFSFSQFVQYLLQQNMVVEVWGSQGGIVNNNNGPSQMTTKQLMNQDTEKADTANKSPDTQVQELFILIKKSGKI